MCMYTLTCVCVCVYRYGAVLISNCELRAGQVVTVSLDKTINISTATHVKYLIIIDMSFFVKI